MAREYFCAYFGYRESMKELTDEEKGRLFVACLMYAETGENPVLSGNERFVFPSFKAQIDRDKFAYDDVCRKRAESVNKRWEGHEKKSIQMNTNVYKSIQTDTNDTNTKVKVKDKIKNSNKKTIFISPSLEEVVAYANERNSIVNPSTFFDWNESKGWKVGSEPMKNWKAAFRTWEQREKERGVKSNRPQKFKLNEKGEIKPDDDYTKAPPGYELL